MSKSRDLATVAWAGLRARKVRTMMIMLGPVIGVAAMVSAVGLTESAKGALQAQLAQLGTNLIIAQAGSSFGSQNPTLPANAVERVENISTVTSAAATGNLSGVIALPVQGASSYYQAFPVPVRAAGDNLPAVLGVPVLDGRWLNRADTTLHLRSVVLGEGIAKQYGYLPGETRTIQLNGKDFGVVGVLDSVPLDPTLDNAAFVTEWAAKHLLGTTGRPNQLYIRARTGTTQATAKAVPTAVNLGGTVQVSTQVPSDALAAQAQANKTLQEVALLAGLLALTVGGIGIANVMSISVIQRSSEIGIRRAVGHSRSTVGSQFLLESLFIGILGGAVGAVLGILVVYGVSALAGWTVVIAYAEIPVWMGLALLVSVVAGLYPSIKAARLEPLETLRLG
ncbi:MAG TPA: ABC transporter permease [Acidimicrobiales bacterium]|nr:ABC transporter permease [Acidimicrobiales bacterium]